MTQLPTLQDSFFFLISTQFVLFCDSNAEGLNKYSSPNWTNVKSDHPNFDWSKSLLVIN